MVEFIGEQSNHVPNDRDLVRIYTTSNQVQAHLICSRLSEEGLDATVVGDFIEQGQPLPSCIEILVPKGQAKVSEKFLQKWKIRTEQKTHTEPFSVWTTAAFLFISVSLVAFVGVSFENVSPWMLATGGLLITLVTSYWLRSQFVSQPKLK